MNLERAFLLLVVSGIFLLLCQPSISETLSGSKDLSSPQNIPRRRQKRLIGATIGTLIGQNAKNESEPDDTLTVKLIQQQQDQHEETMRVERERFCFENCAEEWGAWSSCSAPCGGGTSTRRRNKRIPSQCGYNFYCTKSPLQEKKCNPGCSHGGTENGGKCTCPIGRTGQCCEQEVRCDFNNSLRNGNLDGTFPASVGSVVTYSCWEGYSLVGDSEIVCDAKGVCDIAHLEADCGPPRLPLYGGITGGDFSLGGEINVSCTTGYRLIGSTTRTCLASGTWSGYETVCSPITCDPPVDPRNGRALPVKEAFMFGTYVTIRCDSGFELRGKQKLKCIANEESIATGGQWDAETPTCEAVSCGDPGVPEQGAKDSINYNYPSNITYSCFSGYILRGASVLHCPITGIWTAPVPDCIACPVNTYTTISHSDECQPCPPNTHTVTSGSNSLDQCICDSGYKSGDQGACEEIRCSSLVAPSFGSMSNCDNRFGSICQAYCDDGYVLSSGTSQRQCREDSEWSGSDPVCHACPINTYKGHDLICIPCPKNSHTTADAQSFEGCVCNAGYDGPPGGPCEDIDECAENGGRGNCSEVCMNRIGGYDCGCSIQGYVIDPRDKHSCICKLIIILSNLTLIVFSLSKVDKTCRNLTMVDAPKQGALVCHWYREENSQQCSVRCNPGYEFPSRVNNYESCGPSTGYKWSHEVNRTGIFPSCIEEFFPDFHHEADAYYLTTSCENMTLAEKEDVKQTFADMLKEHGICMKRRTQICDIKNIGIICGATRRRKRRDADGRVRYEHLADVDIQMEVAAHKVQDRLMDCDQICVFLKISQDECESMCEPAYKRFLRAAVHFTKSELTKLYRTRSNVHFQAASRHFESDGLETKDVRTKCQEGMAAENELCVPCQPGSFLHNDACIPCATGFYQPLERQLACFPCPIGTTSMFEGAPMCDVCTPGTYGLQCNNSCSECVHGTCHARTGECLCESGWEGPSCNTDIMGCKVDSCFPGVNCWDINAPGTGFFCEDCPEGFRGDGVFCEMIPFERV
ncbi:hypothetical protein CAPTEDRAFT_212422 [Capitella teleta]|uniref:Sushi, von Willebrand factor type A, EGF and pentraxin domain-containing protein 1 n=1 Tax=Capitella teleta TaxID=283909 RepID=R7U763_CAPTE|nr:hypothetical protein CAPTEDRAFT_212422 [Capitella teleta]|eukprot:ELU02210.1 hypothetical protein CAPTEDRAFT_212422 [Capitella teleta]